MLTWRPNGGYGLQQFSNPAAIFSEFRPMVLGIDTTAQSGRIPGLSETDVDFGVLKDLQMFEKVSIQLSGQATNVFNHFAPATQNYNINDPADFGAIYGNALSPRQVEIGAIIRW